MPNASDVLARLRETGPDSLAARLAALVVDDVLSRPIAELVDAGMLAETAKEAAIAITKSDAAEAYVIAHVTNVTTELAKEKRKLAQVLPAPLRDGARALAEIPMTPKREVVTTLLDRAPIKQMLRGQIVDTLIQFGKKGAGAVTDNPLARGLGGISKLMASSGPSAIGRVASAVSGEVEKQVEKRATDFADTAVEGVIAGIAAQVSDPAKAKEQAAMRAALLDGVMELTGEKLADLSRGTEKARVTVARKTLAAWAATPAFASDVEAAVAKLMEREASRPLGAVLSELAVLDAVKAHATIMVARGIAHLVAGGAFEAWIAELLG